ncbi:hypothetical protein JOC37_001828 [Desulfohalotomaculum tongense]|uniref:hypothetical protein n=1 Tax=Desulforadius tongensis TaxID=1216062 RepID=UPI00195CA211|nr:hypothetical protein [Desulforadius tongensis]MBM7855433.1 hypothetical protein [Desulforadius tongensis]
MDYLEIKTFVYLSLGILFITILAINVCRQSKEEEKSGRYLKGIVKSKNWDEELNKYRITMTDNGFDYIYYIDVDKTEMYENLVIGKEFDFKVIGFKIVEINN